MIGFKRRINEFPDYFIDEEGNVFSIKSGEERKLKLSIGAQGYLRVWLSKNGKWTIYTVHQLMAIVFLNHKPCGYKLVVDHKNNIKTDNRLCNLQVITNRENSSKEKTDVGVCWIEYRKKWKSQIRIGNTRKFLGYFTDKQEALESYQKALQTITSTENV